MKFLLNSNVLICSLCTYISIEEKLLLGYATENPIQIILFFFVVPTHFSLNLTTTYVLNLFKFLHVD